MTEKKLLLIFLPISFGALMSGLFAFLAGHTFVGFVLLTGSVLIFLITARAAEKAIAKAELEELEAATSRLPQSPGSRIHVLLPSLNSTWPQLWEPWTRYSTDREPCWVDSTGDSHHSADLSEREWVTIFDAERVR